MIVAKRQMLVIVAVGVGVVWCECAYMGHVLNKTFTLIEQRLDATNTAAIQIHARLEAINKRLDAREAQQPLRKPRNPE